MEHGQVTLIERWSRDHYIITGNAYPVNFPLTTMRNPTLNMFQDEDPSYLIRFRALATWEWQLSQHKLCCVCERGGSVVKLTRMVSKYSTA